jgi:farnesyl-diphosphate farnesyltransferase
VLLLGLLRASSRTFAVGIERLPPALREPVQVAYLLLRISDYLEDNETMEPARKARLLELWDDILGGEQPAAVLLDALELPEPLTPDATVARAADLVLDALDTLAPPFQAIVRRHVRDSTRGMARWARRGPDIATEADLDDYMHEVAGRVGYLLTELFAAHSRSLQRRAGELMPLAREFGLGLQTVNVIRGLRKDYERGWIYVPDSFMPAGSSRESLFLDPDREPALRVLDRLADKADRHLQAALRYVKRIPPWQHQIRVFCMLPLLFAVRTLALSRGDDRVFQDEVKIGRTEVQRIVLEAVSMAWSNRWLEHAVARLARP